MAKLIPKHQRGKPMWQTESMPQYYDLKERIRKEDPALYNKQEQEYAAQQHPTSEFIIWKNSNGQIRRTPQVIGMSGADPIGQLYVEGAALNPVFKGLGRVAEYGLAKAGNKWARMRQINRSFKPAIDRFDGTVGKEYFKSPDKWYRVTETPEVHGIEEVGRNVTTRDAADIIVPSDKWRRSVIDNNLIPVKDGGWSVKKSKFIFSKRGQAHGNTSQAAKGQIWGGTFAKSNKFPNAILEGNLKNKVHRGFDPATGTDSRTNFVLQDWESIPNGARIGFHTGEMPMNGLKAFTELPSGRFRMEPVIPNKTISVKSNNVLASIYDNPDQYRGRISDRVIDYMKQRKEVGKSLKDSRDFIQSTAVKNSKETNQRIADRLGLPRQAEYDLQHKPVIYHYKFGQKNYNLKGVSPDNVGGYYDRTKKTINLRENYHNLQTAKSIPFHENLHAQGYGSSAVNDWKIQYLIDKDKVMNMSKRNKDYFLSSEELPVHTATLGESWGVKPGQSYPGDKAFDEMLYNNGIGGASYYLKYDTPKDKRRFWRTLNGTMFGLSPAIINKNTQPSN